MSPPLDLRVKRAEHLENCIEKKVNSRRKKHKENRVGLMKVNAAAISKVNKLMRRTRVRNIELLDQANKSIGWMPWHQEPKKDVVSCEKPW